MPSVIAAITMPGKLPSPPSTQMAKMRPIYSRPIDGSTGWMMIRQAPASEAVAIDRPKAMRLILVGLAAISRSASWSCATAWMARPMKVRDRKSCRPHHHRHRDQERHQQPQRQVEQAEMQAGPDIGRLHRPVVDAEDQHQRDLGDEQQAEEERQAAQRLVVAPLEGDVVDLIDRHAEQVEGRQQRSPPPGSDRCRTPCCR